MQAEPPPAPSPFFAWFETNGGGLLYALLCVFAAAFLLNWMVWLFRAGRFRASGPAGSDSVISVTNTFLTKIILDFRNFLALLIVLIFAVVLAVAFAMAGSHADQMNAVQVVTASLGPLVGSLMGYYFGERAALARPSDGGGGSNGGGGGSSGALQQPTPDAGAVIPTGITPAPSPDAPPLEEPPQPDGDG